MAKAGSMDHGGGTALTAGVGLRLEHRPLDALAPYERNARTHSEDQVARIAASIREFGFANPVLVDGSNGVIAGHGRVMAARKLGLATVPVIILAHLTDAQKRALALADNRLALDAGWDEHMLRMELGDLQAEGFDLDLTGFDMGELARLFDDETARLEHGGAPGEPIEIRQLDATRLSDGALAELLAARKDAP